MEFLGQLGLPKVELETMDFQHGFQTRSYLIYHQFLKDTEIGKNLLKGLSEDPRVNALVGQMVSFGSRAIRFEINTLAMWLAWCTNYYGERFANEQLESWLNAEEVEVLNCLWVLGVEVDESIELSGGYVIRTIADMPDSDDKEYFNRKEFNYLSRTSLPKCAITKWQKIKKMWSDVPPVSSALSDEYRASTKSLYELAFILNSLDGVTCVPNFHTAYRDETTPIGYFGGSGGGATMFDVSTLSLSKISAASAPEINEMFSRFQLKGEPEKARLQLILNRLSQAKRRIQLEDKMLDLGIALEMLLLDDNDKDQLALQFRLRGSWLIGKSSQDRLEKWNLLQEIYNARSSVAHTGTLHNNNPSKIQKILEALPMYLSLSEAILRKIIISGPPVWRDLVLGVLADANFLVEGSGQAQPDEPQ
ncbi:hypothetical protein [Hydrogenophaga sp.]|uniref:hypothetical protein n=1 Tax=Hydrogenophaga sp. TaxID=1904254 RepID=UPI003F7039FF